MWTLVLACVAPVRVAVVEPEPVVYPVDATFTGDVSIPGANVVYYDVVGRDDAEVLLALRAGSVYTTGAHAARTDWAVRWERPDGGACATADIRVFAELTVHMPRWIAPAGAPAASIGNWQRYVRALRDHEQGHVERILAVVERMPAVLAEGGCDEVDARGREALEVIREANVLYDADTAAGATQGAVLFPPRR